VTDADAALGYLPIDGFAAGRMTLDVDAARQAIDRDVAQPLGLDLTAAAWGIERIVNANMANATRRILSSYGADPRDLSLIAYGGNGGVHAWAIASELGIARVLVPKAAPAFSALGLLVADYVFDRLRSYICPLSQVDVGQLRSLAESLASEAAKELEPVDLPSEAVHQSLFVQMCYPGQNFDMSVPVNDAGSLEETSLLDLADRFHDLHESDRGFSFRNQQPIVRGIRLVTRGDTPEPSRLAPSSPAGAATQSAGRPVFWDDGFIDTPVVDGTRVDPGFSIEGPALIQELFTVVAVPPAGRLSLDHEGTYHLDVHLP
jgi:N-methylhydantoinase A